MTNSRVSTVERYLSDLGKLILEAAREAKQARDSANAADRDYESGKLIAYNEVVSLMQQQAEAFGMNYEHVGLAGVNPDRDLV